MELKKLEAEITKKSRELSSTVNNFNPKSPNAMRVNKRIDLLTKDICELMMKKHFLIDVTREDDIDADNQGEVYSLTKFRQMVLQGHILDEDGVGFYVTDKNKETDIQVMADWVARKETRGEFSFIIWYPNNKESEDSYDFGTTNFMDVEEEF